jgi:hypothetical protein
VLYLYSIYLKTLNHREELILFSNDLSKMEITLLILFK